jgi:hypothetical protein
MKSRIHAVALSILLALSACDSHDHVESTPYLEVVISGESGALSGFAFPPASPNDLAFVDGWDVTFDRILVTIDDIRLSEQPDLSPTDQAQAGPLVATAKGPWAFDMTKPGASTTVVPRSMGHEGGGLVPLGGDHGSGEALGSVNPNAQLLARFDTLEGGRSFDPTLRYAFGFDLVNATQTAKRTNLNAEAEADYQTMISEGVSVLYVGTATFKGNDCRSSDPAYDYSTLPKVVRFRFGFKTPTSFRNCQNTDLRGKPFDGEEAQRGVQVSAPTTAQITLHVDHPFWNTVDHDAAELFFDQMAAAASPDGLLTLDDLGARDVTSLRDRNGRELPWRSCVASKPVKPGMRKFDPGSVRVDPAAPPETALRHYLDYVAYVQSTQGHLNADGLCAVQRNFSSPR